MEGEEHCIVCGHRLSSHIWEGDGWRCHSLGPDLCQCECFLRLRDPKQGLYYYSLERRIRKACTR